MPDAQPRSPATASPIAPEAPNSDVTEPRDLLRVLFAEVRALAHQLRKKAASVHSQGDSPAGGWGIMQILDRLGPQNVPAIARRLTLSRQNVQTTVNRLESHGYVTLTPNPAHKKSGLVCLTDRGRNLLSAYLEREADSMEGLLPHVAEARLVRAAKLLRQLRQLLAGHDLRPDGMVEERPPRMRVAARPSPVRARKPAPASAAPASFPAEPSQSEESEFPVNLL